MDRKAQILEELHCYAKSFGARCTGESKHLGVKKNGKKTDPVYRFVKDGYDDRWVYKSSLTQNSNPFNTPTPNETMAKHKDWLWQIHGAKFTGNVEHKNGRIWYFEVSKPGYENRLIPTASLTSKTNPWFRLTEGEQRLEMEPIAAALGAQIVGYQRNQRGDATFELAKEGYGNRKITLASARLGSDPFHCASATINEQKQEVTELVKRFFGVVFTGAHRKNKCGRNNEFELRMGNRTRWTTLAAMRSTTHPFTKTVLSELIDELEILIKPFGALFTGNTRRHPNGKTKNHQFELAKDGYENRWSFISNLRKKKDPFLQPTIGELEKELRLLISPYPQITYTGRHNGKNGPYRRFLLAMEGRDDRWVHIQILRDGGSPFTKPTIAEQLREVDALAKKTGAYATGRQRAAKRKGEIRKFELAKKGYQNRWITLAGLRLIGDPFISAPGYQFNRPGFLYVLRVSANGRQCIKLGITNHVKNRLKAHQATLAKIGACLEPLQTFRFEDPYECLHLETALKRQYKNQSCNLGVSGFQDECFAYDINDELLEKLQIYKQNP